MKPKNTQKTLFPAGEDLPLFSGTPVSAEEHAFIPETTPQQAGMFACGACRDTGVIGERFCTCEAGRIAREEAGQ